MLVRLMVLKFNGMQWRPRSHGLAETTVHSGDRDIARTARSDQRSGSRMANAPITARGLLCASA
jgi:hypothetical protein